MASSRELTSLLTKLASHLRPPPGGAGRGAASISAGDSISAYISSLAASLDSGGGASSRTSVLDATLSLMCFETLEVDRARIECLVRTIVSALSASVSCRVVRPDGGGAEMLTIGSSILPGDCRELVRSCAALLGKWGDHDGQRHSYALLYAVAKVAVLSPRYQRLFTCPYYIEDGDSICDMGTIAQELTSHPSLDIFHNAHSIPQRVLLWHLDPSILKHDLSAMVQEAVRRPLLCLRQELFDRMAWRLIIICLVCSPFMFMEMRALFHSWFLLTGLGSVLELHTGLVSSVLDVLFRPMSWGISMERGQKFPFSCAYFPSKHADLLAILTGPLSCGRFLNLVSYIEAAVDLGKGLAQEITCHSSQKNFQLEASKGLVDYNSAWSMILNFPVWFDFATALIFRREGSQDYLSQALIKEIFAESINDVNLSQRAAFYLSWVLCPINEGQRKMLANNILELSHSLVSHNKRYSSYAYHTSTVNHRRKPRIPTAGSSEKLHTSTEPVSSLLKEFDDHCAKFCSLPAICQVQAEGFPSIGHSLLHLRIPLGILIVSPSCVNEQECDIILHYASTGQVRESNVMQRKAKYHASCDAFSISCRDGAEKWASSGACLILDWLDVIDDMSVLIFECDDVRRSFISQLKTKTSPYLLKCVNLLLEAFNVAGQGSDFEIDLHDRLLHWKQKGESFEGHEAFEDVMLKLKNKFQLS